MTVSRRVFSSHEVRQGTMMDIELMDKNLDSIFMGAVDSVFYAALEPHLPFAACPETFPVTSAKTGGRWEVEMDTPADMVTDITLAVELPGLVGKRMDGTSSSAVVGVVRNGDDLGARYATGVEDIVQPYWCEAVGQRLIKKAKFTVGAHTLSVSNADYLMILSEGHGNNKPRTSGERIGYYGNALEACERSMRSQLLFVNMGFFMCQDDRLALSFASIASITKKVVVDYEDLDNLIVRPIVPWNRSTAEGGNDWVNAWDVGHFRLFEQPDSAALYSHASASRELLTSSITQIELNTFIQARTIYTGEDESEALQTEGHVMTVPQLQHQTFSISGAATDDHEKSVDLNFTNGVKALYIVGRTQASRESNDWMDTSGGHDGRELVPRDVLAYCKLLQGTSYRIDSTGDELRRVEGYRYFGTEPRQAKTMLYAHAYENYRDLAGQQGVVNLARLRTKRITLTAPKHAFEIRRIDNASGDMVLSGEETRVEFYTAVESFQTLTFKGQRVLPAFSTPGHT